MAPFAPLHPCNTPGCGALVPRGVARCTVHQRQRQAEYNRRRGSSTQQGYGQEHRRWREEVLTRDPVCRMCCRRPSTVADHIISRRKGGAQFDLANGQGLCATCHGRKTVKQDGRWRARYDR
jgi:5-methylcytosine-specific restriction enzyme A